MYQAKDGHEDVGWSTFRKMIEYQKAVIRNIIEDDDHLINY